MTEGAIWEFVKWFIGLLLLLMLISVTIFFIELEGVNSYKQQVNYQIERKGGLTADAVAYLDSYSKTYYKGRFTIESDKLNEKVSYGEMVDYEIKGKFDIKIFPIPDVELTFKGTGVSQVR
ncbi:hypothetical protein NSQ61_19740 [Aeribacillus sp. FSL K6-1121]|uniref:hypothetical protein n=1 Tax=Aeribacillus sp. FSL K6-1121 TaxID=2954745 RepID=UPI0030F8A8AD